jgi:hypothetical protein
MGGLTMWFPAEFDEAMKEYAVLVKDCIRYQSEYDEFGDVIEVTDYKVMGDTESETTICIPESI